MKVLRNNNKTINYTSLLRHPLKFNESGLVISFSEIVLVEPGDPGSVFGSENFYDYVIVEGSKNFGKTWFGLADGYDSRLLKTWETAYNSAIVEMNSTAAGKESMLNKHTLYYPPSDKISAGDTILLRFRLFSDPYANGWGWVIEDLKINPLVDAVEDVTSGKTVRVYPNPGNGVIRISTDDEVGKPIRYAIYTTSGFRIRTDYLPGDAENVIDLSDRPAGIYIIVLYRDDWIKTVKYSLIK
ncbi:MAG: T9SS type A sorting domain-containing protein [Bacteroidales bacterium]|nr:T9SS type A sorting domain-containing protein [Bacteroidales bacterium]